mmetsp:Transcript_11149/g.17216  ORF Transcript_11149/g.17216 Transcript_11149/m.17216 type:complete len:512 (+) Transcript_11149:168-1703(+)
MTFPQVQSRKLPTRRSRGKRIGFIRIAAMIVALIIMLYLHTTFHYHSAVSDTLANPASGLTSTIPSEASLPTLHEQTDNSDKKIPKHETCNFRKYSSRRYYGLPAKNQPNFLQNVEYIYGEYPFLLAQEKPTKLCVDQSEWLKNHESLPFADGTNPSILHLDRMSHLPEYNHFQEIGVTYLATVCMTNSQCQWGATEEEIKNYNLSTQDKPDTLQTLLLLLDADFEVLSQASIVMERDAPWGRKKLKPQPLNDEKTKFGSSMRPLDDARLFVNKDEIWVSYRDGPNFGYDKQVLNRLHFDNLINDIEEKPQVMIRASESTTLCCGRNMALINNKPLQLQALTWVDPVTVEDVNIAHNRRLTSKNEKNKKKSHVHGTNAFMVPFGEKEEELLGMAHFHRPNDRNPNEYARVGHHYTHAFFTISAKEPFHLKRLSAEFVLQSYHQEDDAEIIQFISGLEHHDDNVILAWGINDCEGASARISTKVVNKMLRKVDVGKEVVDFMMKPDMSSAVS